MTKLPFSMTAESLTIYSGGLTSTFRAGTVQYKQIAKAILEERWDEIPTLMTPGGALAKYLGGMFSVSVEGDKIAYDGVMLPEELNGRINAMAAEGLDPSPLLRFYERLHKNPSFRSRTQVFGFLKHLNISIEPDGTFLAYKGIREDYTDQHSGKVNNTPGTVNKMARNLISDDPTEYCHFGFHVGALSYASGFGPVVVICRVDPEHVVCVPDDHNAQKMRVCEYVVVGEWSGETMAVISDDEDLPDEEYEVDLDDDEEDQGYEEAESYEGENDYLHEQEQPAVPEATRIKSVSYELDTLDTKGLMKKSIEELRKYASGRLKIHGASKIPGGKATLVSKIMRIRRRLAK